MRYWLNNAEFEFQFRKNPCGFGIPGKCYRIAETQNLYLGGILGGNSASSAVNGTIN